MADTDRSGRDEGFLARWSQRKRAVREAEATDEAAAQAESEAAAEAPDEETLAANRAAAEAVDLDSLDVGSDMSPFFKSGVPAALRQAALRKLWRSNPVFACLDGLNDYDENFNDPKLIMKVAKTSWEVGSGYAKRLAELKEQAKEAIDKVEVAVDGDAVPAETTEPAEAAQAEHASEAAADPAEVPAEAEPEAEIEEAAPEEAEPAPRVPLRTRLDFAAFKDGG